MKQVNRLIVFAMSAAITIAAHAGKGRNGMDPRVNRFFEMADKICDTKILSEVQNDLSVDRCKEVIVILRTLTVDPEGVEGGVSFVDRKVYDSKGREKICTYNAITLNEVECGVLWNPSSAQDKLETVAAEIAGLSLQVKDRYAFGAQVRALSNADGTWKLQSPACDVCKPQTKFEQWQEFFKSAKPLDMSKLPKNILLINQKASYAGKEYNQNEYNTPVIIYFEHDGDSVLATAKSYYSIHEAKFESHNGRNFLKTFQEFANQVVHICNSLGQPGYPLPPYRNNESRRSRRLPEDPNFFRDYIGTCDQVKTMSLGQVAFKRIASLSPAAGTTDFLVKKGGEWRQNIEWGDGTLSVRTFRVLGDNIFVKVCVYDKAGTFLYEYYLRANIKTDSVS